MKEILKVAQSVLVGNVQNRVPMYSSKRKAYRKMMEEILK